MKRMLCTLISVFMLFCTCAHAVTAATDEPCVAIGHASGCAGETVTLPIEIAGNPGIVALRLSVQYDSTKLQLLEVTDDEMFGSGNSCFGHDITADPYTLLWEDGLSKTNHTANGQIAALTFRILDGAPVGKTDLTISLDAGSTFNVDMQNVPFSAQHGFVHIEESAAPETHITGVTVQDLTMYYKESGSLQVQAQAVENAEYTITFQPENEKVIAVDDKGRVTALHWGTTKVVVTVTDEQGNMWTDSCVVQVNCHLWQRIIIVFLFGWIWY